MGRLQSAWTKALAYARVWTPRVIRALLALSLLLIGALALIGLTILRRQGDIPPLGPQVGAIAAIVLFALLLFALWWAPRRQARTAAAEATALERMVLEDRLRRTLAGIVGGIILLLMLGVALRTAALVQTNALSERFARATAQLGSDQLTARMAGVHSLEAIAATSGDLRRSVYEVLNVFVRERAVADSTRGALEPAPDVMAAVTVIARRAADGGAVPLHLNFSGANLRALEAPNAWLDFSRLRNVHLEGADLRGARIAGKGGADLRGARLDSANLSHTHLDGIRMDSTTVLYRANLRGADLDGATLRGVDLRFARLDSAEIQGAQLQLARLDSASLQGAILRGATLTGAVLTGADFAGAILEKAHLVGTDLSAVRNLTTAQLAAAYLDATTALPPGVPRPQPKEPPRP